MESTPWKSRRKGGLLNRFVILPILYSLLEIFWQKKHISEYLEISVAYNIQGARTKDFWLRLFSWFEYTLFAPNLYFKILLTTSLQNNLDLFLWKLKNHLVWLSFKGIVNFLSFSTAGKYNVPQFIQKEITLSNNRYKFFFWKNL